MNVTRLYFLETEVREWIWRMHQIRLPQRTCANWRASGIIRASARWMDGPERSGMAARGSGRNACRYTVGDFARVRLVALLRYALRLSMTEIRGLLDRHGVELAAILKRRSDAVILMDPVTRQVLIRRRGSSDFDVRANQYTLDLRPLTEGNEAAAREARQRIA